MICKKSFQDVLFAVFVLTLILFSFGTTFLGIFRYIFDLKDDQYLNRDHLILAGNMLQVASLGGTIYILSKSESGPLQLGLILAMFFLLILVLYLTNFDAGNENSEWAALVFLVVDVYVKVTSLLIGFGVCSMDDISSTVSQMASTLVKGGKRK